MNSRSVYGRVLLTAALTLVIRVIAAQQPGKPKLPHEADTNDWEAYFDYAVTLLPRLPTRADSMFAWASRLDPSRAEPLYARWVCFWLKDVGRFERYLNDDQRTLESPAVLAVDTLYLRALHRNPFVPQTLGILPYDQLPGEWRHDLYTLGWIAYARRDFAKAAQYFGEVVRSNPQKHIWSRYMRALAFVPMRAYDSASTEMTAILTMLRAREDTTISSVYHSKELIDHGIALLQLAQNRQDSARWYFQHSLDENLGFYPAHAMLGDLALARGDSAVAAREFEQAAELAPNEPWIQFRYGAALLRMGRSADAIAPLQRAIVLDPFYAAPYFDLGVAESARGNNAEAARALQQYLERAPRKDTDAAEDARRRLASLREPDTRP